MARYGAMRILTIPCPPHRALVCGAAAIALLITGACTRTQAPAPVIDKSGATFVPTPEPSLVPTLDPSLLVTGAGAWITVGRGETLYQVARRHRVPLRELIQLNRLTPPYRLAPGLRLKLPPPRIHVVRRGETVYRIARKYSISIAKLVRANDIQPPGYRIIPGQRLRLPGAGTDPDPSILRSTARPFARPAAGPVPGRLTLTPPPKSAGEIAKPRRKIAKPRRKAESVWAVERTSRPSTATSGAMPAPPPRAGSFGWPLRGKVVARFGPTKGGSFNDGINILAPRGARVRAAENGVVAYVGNELPGYGNLLLIRHRGGWMTAYAHNDTILVRRGQTVRKGQSIARVGSTGNVHHPQLHFELRRGLRPVNPRKHLKGRGRS